MSVKLAEAVEALEAIAPPSLAAEWDNVGLLLAPTDPRPVERVLLTIDLTAAVLDEAERRGSELVVAYHPPIFKPLAALADQPVVTRLAEQRMAVYAPHTALDAAVGGVTDWLAEGLGQGEVRTLHPAVEEHGAIEPQPGMGRAVTLEEPAALDALAERVKSHLSLSSVRVAASPAGRAADASVATVALCPGAGGSVIRDAEADLLLTGEMRHHETLAANARGRHVILTDHTNTERGYLPRLRDKLDDALGGRVSVEVAEADAEPLQMR